MTTWASQRDEREARGHPTGDAVIEAAGRVFARSGFARTTMAAIADEAGVARASVYLYFTSKDDVFAEVAAGVRDEMLAAHDIPGVDPDDPVAIAHSSTEAFLRAYSRHFDLLTVIEHQALSDPAIAAIWSELTRRPLRRTVNYVARLAADGRARPAADPADIAEAVVGMIAQYARRKPADGPELRAAVTALSAMYLRLVGLEPPRGPAAAEAPQAPPRASR